MNETKRNEIFKSAVDDAVGHATVESEKEKGAAVENAKVAKSTDEEIREVIIDETSEDDDAIVKLSTKVKFEGEIIESIDLSGIKDLTATDAQRIEKLYRKTTKSPSVTPEVTIDYAMAAASIITGKPLEFFKQLGIRDTIAIKNKVVNFLYAD